MSPPTPTLALAAVACLASGFAWAGPQLNSTYQGDAFGPIELRSDGEHLTGTAPAGGPCQRPVAEQILTGDFQGNVFLGEITLCQTGDTCTPSRSFPLMLVYNVEERALAGVVKLEGGCESPALPRNGMLVLRATEQGAALTPAAAPATEQRQAQAPAPPPPSGGAAQVAAQRRLEPLDVAATLKQGQSLLAQNPIAASQQFQLVLAQEKEKNNAWALTGMGVAHYLRKQHPEALKYLEQARNVGSGAARAEAFFWTACVKRAAQESGFAQLALRQAVQGGWSAPENNALVERELQQFANEGAEYELLLKQARGRKRVQGREPQGAGSASP
ncbi:type IV pilus biogenesis/stability protein PilW [Corallococcus exercitus]|uniref:tetratricopeptide repeat protein n=1 Tax=Corallococcus exercitus TaxID=2316736 RepID=UPI0035D44941